MVYYIEYKNYSKGYFCQYESHIFQGIWLLLWSLKHQLILTIFSSIWCFILFSYSSNSLLLSDLIFKLMILCFCWSFLWIFSCFFMRDVLSFDSFLLFLYSRSNIFDWFIRPRHPYFPVVQTIASLNRCTHIYWTEFLWNKHWCNLLFSASLMICLKLFS